ncbi:MAG: hypothetical protein B7X06_01100, partial [Verrucomicrobia bacterium 21-51-4]
MTGLQVLESRTLLSATADFDKKLAMDEVLREFADTYVAEHGQVPPVDFTQDQLNAIQAAINNKGFKCDQTLAREAWKHNYEA